MKLLPILLNKHKTNENYINLTISKVKEFNSIDYHFIKHDKIYTIIIILFGIPALMYAIAVAIEKMILTINYDVIACAKVIVSIALIGSIGLLIKIIFYDLMEHMFYWHIIHQVKRCKYKLFLNIDEGVLKKMQTMWRC